VLSDLHAGRLQREEANPFINPHNKSHSFTALLAIYKVAKAQVPPGGRTIILPIGSSCDRYMLASSIHIAVLPLAILPYGQVQLA
jgi:hypothetical protein